MRLTVRRMFGLDRSGPEPPQTRKGMPLRPFTIPNAVGYVRLALIPVFLWLAFDSADGRGPAIATIFALISFGDYVDGFLARLTGQYSRLGALMDPVIDRLTILSGVVVCWEFDLLPRLALAVLAARELVTLLIAQWGLRHGVDVAVNWPGRIAVFPIMGAIAVALAVETPAAAIALWAGIALAILATVLYARAGLAAA
ncbi:MAG TPA: CDP-alcohol phosphatidyltransferase family protein, partial [Solirubrobacterales bacterium]|nr:CDP-alcohol phosphatidyltransferase family protein [Solirubrobacterales bacterium]